MFYVFLFNFYDLYRGDRYVGNMTLLTDENGFASLERTDGHFVYKVVTKNLVTYQSNLNYWFNQIVANITPIVDYIDESTGNLYLNNTTITFEFSSNATGEVIIFLDEDAYYDDFIEDGRITFDFPSFGVYDDVILRYMGSEVYYIEEYKMEEIAKIIGKTTSAVKMRLQKGRKLLKETYGKEYM